MPHIAVKLWPGHSEEEKRRLAETLADDAARVLGAERGWFSVTVEDVDSARWDRDVVQPEIVAKRGVLYVRPDDLPDEK